MKLFLIFQVKRASLSNKSIPPKRFSARISNTLDLTYPGDHLNAQR